MTRAAEMDMKEAQDMIESFCEYEYGSEADFSNLVHVPLAYTTTENGRHEIQVYVNLIMIRIEIWIDGSFIWSRQYGSMRDLINNELCCLDFDNLVSLPDSEWKNIYRDGHDYVKPMSEMGGSR